MKGKEIERKFLVAPDFLAGCRNRLPSSPEEVTNDSFDCSLIEQSYLCTAPVVRVRSETHWQYDPERGCVKICPEYILTCKGKGSAVHDELNLPMEEAAYRELAGKSGGRMLQKIRYRIPISGGLTAELDVFTGQWKGRIVVEVEFPDIETMTAFRKPDWFLDEVTDDPTYRNAWMSRHTAG